MKIALVSPYDYAYPGGVTTHITSLAYEFAKGGHQVKIIAPCSKPEGPLEAPLVPLGRPVPIPSGGSIARISVSFWLEPKVKRLLERDGFDIVHLHEPLAPVVPLLVLHLSKVVNVGTFHAYKGNRFYRLAKPFLMHWFKKLHGRIAVSRPALEFISRYFPGEYQIIPNGIDVDRFAQAGPPITALRDGKINILFVGRMEKRKGLKYLLKAFSCLKWDFPNIRLVVVGPGNPDRECYSILSERNLKDDVVFVGSVPSQELPRYYRSADIFCAPGTGRESFGIVLLEAMAAGIPVVASDIEGYATLVKPGETGFLVKPRSEEALMEALRRLVANQELREAMGARGRAYAEAYHWERIAAQVLDYYGSLLDSRPSPLGTAAAL